MKKDISYKTLIIGMVIYALCGWAIQYFVGVFDVLASREAAEKNIDILWTDNFNYEFVLYLFFIYGVFTITFWSIFLLVNRKNKCFKVRTFVFSLGAMFITYLITLSLGVNDEFMPYFIDFPGTRAGGMSLALYATLINYIAFVILMGIGYLIQRESKAERQNEGKS